MKTLNQVEARTIIDQSQPGFPVPPYTINQAGSYYLGHVFGTGGNNGIVINTSDVTLDLNGFEMDGGNTGSGVGITLNTGVHDVCVRNGTIRNFAGAGIDASGGVNCRFENLLLEHNGAQALLAGSGSTVSHCVADSNGFPAGYSAFGAGEGSSFDHCVAHANAGDGFDTTAGGSISNCVAQGNGDLGIFAYDSVISDCIVNSNAASGMNVHTSTVRHCTVNSNGGTTGHGIIAFESTVLQCTIMSNAVDGIQVFDECDIIGNTIGRTGGPGSGAGIHGVNATDSRIDGNFVSHSGAAGIKIDNANGNNFITRNFVRGHTTDYSFAAGQKNAQVLAPAPSASPSPGFISTDPWANFH